MAENLVIWWTEIVKVEMTPVSDTYLATLIRSLALIILLVIGDTDIATA